MYRLKLFFLFIRLTHLYPSLKLISVALALSKLLNANIYSATAYCEHNLGINKSPDFSVSIIKSVELSCTMQMLYTFFSALGMSLV